MFSRKFGVFSFIVGVLSAVFFYWLKGTNQPVHVTSYAEVSGTKIPIDSGYMTDGWGDAAAMFDCFIVLGIILAILGLVSIIIPKKEQ